MTNFPEILNYILGILFIIIVFSLGYAYLKPHRIHKQFPFSTLLLKTSYLLYLLVILIIIYLSILVKGGMDTVFLGVEFYAFLIILFVPTIGVFARKLGQFRKNHESYYYFFTIVNILSIIALLVLYVF
ncbi:MAG TPA: hypothetical protein DEQ09_00400 [Bacteroidales bacterium]|nr:hypothetical protein [Bacteroidales bacterium]